MTKELHEKAEALNPEKHADKFDPSTGGYVVTWEKYVALSAALAAAEAERDALRELVKIGDVRCEQCGEPATTLDGYKTAACEGCKDAAPDRAALTGGNHD